jgi:2-phospho-L-lactate guanylyltransferase
VIDIAWCIIPLKEPDQAKSRLASVLAPGQRQQLFFLMARQVIRAARETPSITGVAVVTPSGEVARFADALGAVVIADTDERGTAAACRVGIAQLSESGLARVLLLPGDLPLANATDLARLMQSPAQVALVADERGVGTNALLLTPPAVIAPAFGPGSAARHAEAARQAGASFEAVALPKLALDIDDVPDLARLAAMHEALEPELGAFLREIDLPLANE